MAGVKTLEESIEHAARRLADVLVELERLDARECIGVRPRGLTTDQRALLDLLNWGLGQVMAAINKKSVDELVLVELMAWLHWAGRQGYGWRLECPTIALLLLLETITLRQPLLVGPMSVACVRRIVLFEQDMEIWHP